MRAFKAWIGARPYWISLALMVVLTLWMGSGYPYATEVDEDGVEASEPVEHVTRVQARKIQTQAIEQNLDLYGRSEALKSSVLSAEVSGRLLEFLATPGTGVVKGQTLARLALNDRVAQLNSAKAYVEQREIEYQGAQKLSQQGFQGKAALAQAKAALVDATSSLQRLQLNLNNTQIKAPYSGLFSDNIAQVGDFLGIGDPILQLIDTSKIIISADVSERYVASLNIGKHARVRLVTGEELTGVVSFIASVSSAATNTFKVEVLVDNPDGQLKAGVSAEISVPLAVRQAIKVTPAALAIDDEGSLGVKTVEDGIVMFHPIELLRSEADGAWLAGFDGEVAVITLGQGFVRTGDRVDVTWEN